MNPSGPLVFAHIGDLHITKSREQNFIDYLSIVAQLQTECIAQLDFVFIPGDIADNGLPEQYKLVAAGLKMLDVPVYIIPGDHDMEQGSLDNFYNSLQVEKLPISVIIKGIKCIFLDVCGSGKGGPDFRLGAEQLNWLSNEVKDTAQRTILFMHTYPADLVETAEKNTLNNLIATSNVMLVDMGHTHYNDIANDGHTLFTATRSTGQIEEGPVGYSLISIDGDSVSWRFKPLADPFPYVMITSPSDRRLMKDEEVTRKDTLKINTIVFGAKAVQQVNCKLGTENRPLIYNEEKHLWSGEIDNSSELPVKLSVEARDETGRPGQHQIEYMPQPVRNKALKKDGSDADAIEPWPENGFFGTQLGPNRNGKPSS